MAIPANECPLRRVRFLEEIELNGVRLKVVTIVHGEGDADMSLIEAAKGAAGGQLRWHATRHEHHGVGFLGIHDGEGENQVFLDQWINRNELLHTYWVSPKDDPAKLMRAGDDHNSVCVWDLALQCFEREAWMRHVLRNPDGPDIDAYMAERIDEML